MPDGVTSPQAAPAQPDWGQVYQQAADNYGVDPNLLHAIRAGEGTLDNPYQVSDAGAAGPFQLMPEIAKAYGVEDRFDPQQSANAAARLLRENMDRYGSAEMAILAYHGGTDQNNWGPKTHNYLKKVSGAYAAMNPPDDESQQAPAGPPIDSLIDQYRKSGVTPNAPAQDIQEPPAAPTVDPKSLIDAARKRGYSDTEIWAKIQNPQALSGLIDSAKQRGYSDPEIAERLGLKLGNEMPSVGNLPGTLSLDQSLAPKVPDGAPRPFAPGEFVKNPNGSWSSEISVTVPYKNKWAVLPSLWLVDGKAVRVSEDQAAEYAQKSGLNFQTFDTEDEAEKFSNNRESQWQRVGPEGAKSVPPLWGPEDTGLTGAISGGFQAMGEQWKQTAQVAAGKKPSAASAPNTLAAQPVQLSDILHPKTLAEKTLYGLAEGSPMMVGAILGGITGGAVGAQVGAIGGAPTGPGEVVAVPAGAATGTVVGTMLGAGAVSMAQAIGPSYAAELAKTPKDPGGAFDRTLVKAGTEGVVSAASMGLFGWNPFKSAVKNILFQAMGVQPAVSVAGRMAENVEEGQPVMSGTAETALTGAVGTLAPAAVHGAVHMGVKAVLGTPEVTAPRVEPTVGGPPGDAAATPRPADMGRAEPIIQYAEQNLGPLATEGAAPTTPSEEPPAPPPRVVDPNEGKASKPVKVETSDDLAIAEVEPRGSEPDVDFNEPLKPTPPLAVPEKAPNFGPRSKDLVQFLASNGGLSPDAASQLTNLTGKQKFIPFHGPLVKPDGMNLDKALEAATDAGYFPQPYDVGSTGVTSQYIDRERELVNAIDNTLVGKPHYREQDAEREATRDQYQQSIIDGRNYLDQNGYSHASVPDKNVPAVVQQIELARRQTNTHLQEAHDLAPASYANDFDLDPTEEELHAEAQAQEVAGAHPVAAEDDAGSEDIPWGEERGQAGASESPPGNQPSSEAQPPVTDFRDQEIGEAIGAGEQVEPRDPERDRRELELRKTGKMGAPVEQKDPGGLFGTPAATGQGNIFTEPKPAGGQQPPAAESFETPHGWRAGETKHSKTGKDLFVASMDNRVDADEFKRISAIAKQHKGNYSSWRGKGAIPGFQFETAAARDSFLRQIKPETVLKSPIAFEGRKDIGKNEDGHTLQEDANGVRSYVTPSGVRHTEPMAIIPTREGVKTAANRRPGDPEWHTEAERGVPPSQAPIPRAEEPKLAEKPQIASYGTENKVFTADAAAALRERLRNKMRTQIGAGFDPEMMLDGLTLAGYHVEAGARKFADFAKAMIGDLGEAVKPYLAQWYTAVRMHPGFDAVGMDHDAEIGRVLQGGLREPTLEGQEAANGLQNPLRPSTEGLRPEDVHGTAPVGENGSVSPGPERGGSRPAQGSTQGRAEGAGRSGIEPGSGAGSRGAGAGDHAGLPPAGEPGAGRAAGRSAEKPDADVKGTNFHFEPGDIAEARSPRMKAADNVAAIELAKQIIAEQRAATRAEQEVLAKYVGWGGLSGAFRNSKGLFGKGLEEIGARLDRILTLEEHKAASKSTQYAHYTAENVVRSMWDAVRRMGFDGGSVFEPGMGIGHFLGMMPGDLATKSRYQGIEVDPLTANIAKLLYPDSGVRSADFIKTPVPEGAFDLVIGNPPFSDTVIKGDPKYAARGFMLHDYFFAKSLDSVRPGGLLAFVTSAGTMNKLDPAARRFMAERADFVGGVRLPSTAFKKSAGTEVTTDILFFKRKPEGWTALEEGKVPEWTETVARDLPNAEGNQVQGNVSRYFSEHPENVLGREGFFDKLYQNRYAVHEETGRDLDADLSSAINRLPENIMEKPLTPEQRAEMDFASGQKKDGSFYLKNGEVWQYREGAGNPVPRRGKGVSGGLTPPEIDRIRHLIPMRDALRDVFRADLAEDVDSGAKARTALNKHYDTFVKKFGPINTVERQFRRPSRVQQEAARAEAREEARSIGGRFDEGDFDPSRMISAKKSWAEISRARDEARQRAVGDGREFDEGTFDPEEMPDNVIEKYPNVAPFHGDPEHYRLRAIEKYDDATGKAEKRDIFYRNVLTKEVEPEIRSAGDGVLWSLNKFGRLNLDEMASKIGRPRDSIIEELGNSVFRVPGTKDTYQTRDEYLSGDVVSKLETVRAEVGRDPSLQRNLTELEAAQPQPLPPSQISMNIGMPWIPGDVVNRFARDELKVGDLSIKHSGVTGSWSVSAGSYYNPTYGSGMPKWSTPEMGAHEILTNALNRTPPKIYRTETVDGKRTQVYDPIATEAANTKYEEMKTAFSDWIEGNHDLADNLASLYNKTLNRVILRKYDGSYLTTPGISKDWRWRPHQTGVVARVIQSGNTYMAHAVGAGKTSAMIGSGMEMRRLGLVRKPMYVVPNHMLAQFSKEFYEQYPTARIAIADEQNFHTDRRKQFMANVSQEDLDAVIITHLSFGKVPISDEFQEHLIQEQVDQFKEALQDLDKTTDRITIKRIENQVEKLEQKLSARSKEDKDQTNTFEEMGVDFLFVDEAHMFRKLSFGTKQNIKGIDPNGSNMAWDLYSKVRYLDDRQPGRSAVLASGTPVTNTMGELYTISRYLQREALAERNIAHFDSWAQTFGDTKLEVEEGADGRYQPVTRFAKFVNIPELYKMVGGVMDVVTPEELGRYVTRPALATGGRQFHLAPRTEFLDAYQQRLAQRVDAIKARKGPPSKGDDILLSVINDGRHSAIDPRLVDPSLPSLPDSKLNLMIDRAFNIWKKTGDTQFFDPGSKYEKQTLRGPATQMIFANLGISPRGEAIGVPGFSAYRWIKSDLMRRGVPADHIAFIKDYTTAVARQKLFNDMNEGKVRILIGSTQKMGTGVNAQKRLYALHNMDPLWFPADDEQRVGRILRQGNMNPEIEVHDYSTKGTYDSVMWQMMGRKGRFIEQFFRGDPALREMDDLGEAGMYEQASAMSTSDERIIRLTEMKHELDKLTRARAGHDSGQYNLRMNKKQYLGDAQYADRKIANIQKDIAQRVDTSSDNFKMNVGTQEFTKRKEAGEALQTLSDNLFRNMPLGGVREIGEIGGFPIELKRSSYTGGYDSIRIGRNGDESSTIGDSTTHGINMIQSAESILRGFENEIVKRTGEKQVALKRAKDIDPEIGKEFPHSARIDELRQAHRALEEQIRRDNAPPPKPPEGGETPAFSRQGTADTRIKYKELIDVFNRGVEQHENVARRRGYDGAGFPRARTLDDIDNSESVPARADALDEVAKQLGWESRVSGGSQSTASEYREYRKQSGIKDSDGDPLDLTLNVRISDHPNTSGGEPPHINFAPGADTLSEAIRKLQSAHFDDPKAASEDNGGDIAFSRQGTEAAGGEPGYVPIGRGMEGAELTPAERTKAADLISRVDAILDKIAPKAERVAYRSMRATGEVGDAGSLSAAYWRGLIRWALNADSPHEAARHEALHYLRDAGLFDQTEWDTLSRAAIDNDWISKHKITERYSEANHDRAIEEAIAHEFQDWRRSTKRTSWPAPIRKLFERLGTFLGRLGQAARELFGKPATAEDVFRRIEGGEVGRREPAAGAAEHMAAQRTDHPVFYSALFKAIGDLKMTKASGPQWAATIKNLPGVKEEERQWVGVEDWLREQPGTVTKAQIYDYLKAHEVKVQEVVRGRSNTVSPDQVTALEHALDKENDKEPILRMRELYDGILAGDSDAIGGAEGLGIPDDVISPFRDQGGGPTKFGKWTLPGGEHYRELLLTLGDHQGSKWEVFDPKDGKPIRTFDTQEEASRFARSQPGLDYAPNDDHLVNAPEVFRSGHWDEPNVLAHVRFDDRVGPGGEKILHVGEIQSDWHQKGRKQGYKGVNDEPRFDIYDNGRAISTDLTGQQVREWQRDHPDDVGRVETLETNQGNPGGVPNAPFKTTWPELAMKRVIRYAAENGYDRVSWDTGATNADRYDLSKQVNKIGWGRRDTGLYDLSIYLKDGDIIHKDGQSLSEMGDLVGKEVADKISSDVGKPLNIKGYSAAGNIEGDNLKIGGEGMKAFYDKQLPVIANKLGKKFGAKVEPSKIETDGSNLEYSGPEPTNATIGEFDRRVKDANNATLDRQWDDVMHAEAMDGATFKEAMGDHGSIMLAEAIGGKMVEGERETVAAHSLPITPEMRDSVMQGQPLFQRSTEPAFARAPQSRAPIPKEELERLRVAAVTRKLKAPLRTLFNTAPVQRVINGQAFQTAAAAMTKLRHEIGLFTNPLSMGPDYAQAAAKDFANETRRIGQHIGVIDHMIKRTYRPEERAAMGRAKDQESEMRQDARDQAREQVDEIFNKEVHADGNGWHFGGQDFKTERGVRAAVARRYEAPLTAKALDEINSAHPDRGLKTLPADQRALVETLDVMLDRSWKAMKDAGIVHGEGLPMYMPRQFVNMLANGDITHIASGEGGISALDPIGHNLTTAGPKHRKYRYAEETEAKAKAKLGESATMVTDIRVALVAVNRAHRAVSGKSLIQAIKEAGDKTGIISTSDEPAHGFFTIDHPAFHEFGPAFRVDDEGKVVPRMDDQGNMLFKRTPLYVSREFEGPLRAVLTKPPGAFFKAVMTLKRLSMHLIMMSPMTHNMVEYGRAFELMPGKMITFRPYFDGNKFRKNPALMDEAIRGGMVPITGGWWQDVVGVARESVRPEGWWARKPGEALGKGLAGTARAVGAPKWVQDNLHYWATHPGEFWEGTLLWNRVADLQAGIYEHVLNEGIAKGLSRSDATVVAAHTSNRFAGAMPGEYTSNMARKISNIVLFSPSFTYGNLGVIKDAFSGLPSPMRAQISRDSGHIAASMAKTQTRRRAIGALFKSFAFFYGMNAAVQMGIQAIHQWNSDPSGDASDKLGKIGQDVVGGFARRWHELLADRGAHPLNWLNPIDALERLTPNHDNEPGKDNRIFYGLDEQGRALYVRNILGKSIEEWRNWIVSPKEELLAKTSSLVKPLVDTLRNSDYFGKQVYKPGDGSLTADINAVGSVVWHFMQAQVPLTALQGGYDYITSAPEPGLSLAKSILPFMTGITVSRGYTAGPGGAIMRDVQQRHSQTYLEAYPKVAEAVKRGDIETAQKLLLGAGETPQQARQSIQNLLAPQRRTQPHGYLGRAFQRYGTPEDRERLEHVTQ